MTDKKRVAPIVMSDLRKEIIRMPEVISECSGIFIYGRRIRSVLFSTDVAIIANSNADAVLAVYPFTPHPAILKSIMIASTVPVLAGVGGGLTTGFRSANMSLFSESEGAYAVVVNGPTKIETIRDIEDFIDIPIIYTVVTEHSDIAGRIAAGVDILNVSCGPDTPRVVREIRKSFPDFPIMATGGPTDETVKAVIEAGANAVTITPPTNGDLFKKKMVKYRESQED
ncbi:hydrolase [Streptococcus penaeicida]|uniref:Hydrolase n=1 Tax=Streptococcus penaeicida TaxID=1765960 RepID=A0A2N8LDL1_9STRE|nr:hydrolase [Streptococcus penaeicida]PND48250.1 hydrolase [Streptococcus penaeicida]